MSVCDKADKAFFPFILEYLHYAFYQKHYSRGSAIAKIVGNNAIQHQHIDEKVTMYVYEEIINGKKLTEIINETHENVKYLPGHKLPANVVSTYLHSYQIKRQYKMNSYVTTYIKYYFRISYLLLSVIRKYLNLKVS